jgi:hypothetical protein
VASGGFPFDNMRLPLILPPFFASVVLAAAQPVAPPAPAVSPREVALDNLLSERESEAALAAVITEARKAGVSEQAILEARFLYHVDRNEDEAIAALLPDFVKQRDAFDIEQSAIFSVKEDWLAVTEYVHAIAALTKGDKAAFKTHITEAFWLSPRQASAFAPHIDRLRLEDSMREVKIDFDSRLIDLKSGDGVQLKSLLEGKKAMIFHFWSPSSSESVASMPDYIITAKELEKHGIAMVSILPQDSPQILTEARAAIHPLGLHPPGAWVIDRKENPLSRELRVATLPLFVVVSNEGRVVFNGDPVDANLWSELQKMDSAIRRPDNR